MKLIKRYEIRFEKSIEISEEDKAKMLEWLKENGHLYEGESSYDRDQWEKAYREIIGGVESYAPENALTVSLDGEETTAELIDHFIEL
jgi:hypothetical protein